MDDMHDQHETPTSDAASSVGHYLTGALAATDLAIRIRTWLTHRQSADQSGDGADSLQPGDLEQADTVLDPRQEACRAMLGRDSGRDADSRTALLAWVSAQPHRADDPEAELVAGHAEARLRDLHPHAMSRYDVLRAGLSPVEAMREVAPLIAVEQQHTHARELFAPMLDPAVAAGADSRQALTAWSAALPLADSLPDAAEAAAAAEGRLRELHPDALDRYDTLLGTRTPAAALDEVGPLLDPAHSNSSGVADLTRQLAELDQVDLSQAGAWQENTHELLQETLEDALQALTQPAEQRYAPVVRQVLPAELAEQVLHEQAWPALAGALAKAEQVGARPADLLAAAAGERELGSAKSVADVLAFRLNQRQASAKAIPLRMPTAADLVASSYPTPLTVARPSASAGTQDVALLGAALELGREPDIERQTAWAPAAADNISTPHVDERREGLYNAQPHVEDADSDQAAAEHITATELLRRAGNNRAAAPPGSTAAAHSYPTPIKEVVLTQAAGKHAVAPARPAAQEAPVTGRRL